MVKFLNSIVFFLVFSSCFMFGHVAQFLDSLQVKKNRAEKDSSVQTSNSEDFLKKLSQQSNQNQKTKIKREPKNSFLSQLTKKARRSKSSSTVAGMLQERKNELSTLLQDQENDRQLFLKEQAEDKIQKQKLQQAQLLLLKNYYGNPDYQKAIKIVNDIDLQRRYQQDLSELQFYFFEYIQKNIQNQKMPTVDKKLGRVKDGLDQAGSLFLGSLQQKKSLDGEQKKLKDTDNLFLRSLQEKKI
ncbi:hypothetical protein HYV11_00590 [Candidatus Dependentiae bacterium]|nr:hypothetical protein [Candidatus Dependentiae bacterium]